MTASRFLTIALAALLSLEVQAAAPARRGFDAFPALAGRNIFNPDRQMDAATAATPSSPVETPVTSTDAAALTGTLLTGKKALAFFTGSRPEWCGVLGVGASIAGARIASIDRNGIEIQREGKTIAVAVGQSVPLDANTAPASAPVFAPSVPSAPAAPSFASQPGTAPQPSSAAASNPVTVPADREAILRRMMEKRQQELK